MRTSVRTLVLAAALALAAFPASAAVLRVLSADERGVTLQVNTENWSLSAPDALTGRARIIGVPEARSLATPGHALLPAYSALLAVPTDARPTVRVLSAAAPVVREGVKLRIAGRPAFRPDPDGGPEVPYTEIVDPIVGGTWPAENAVLGAPTPFRGRRLVSLEARPFRYDEGAARLEAVPTLTVRVDWNRPAGAAALALAGGEPDPGMDAALASTVLNFEQARAWRVSPRGPSSSLFARPSSATAFDESNPEVRVVVDSTGLYQLPFDLLAAKGYPANVPIAQVAVHRHEFVEGTSPAYVTVDVPVEVDDADGNGLFGSGDLIWMYARTWAERSGASQYQRWWGDADAVFVTRLATGGARIPARPGWRGASGLTPLPSYPLKTHYEKNGAIIMPYVWVPQDTTVDIFHWTENNFYYDRQDTILFDANNPDTSRSVAFTVNWVGRKFGSHFEWAAVRNGAGQISSIADSVRFFEKRPYTANATLFGSSLTPGRTNSLRVWGRATAGAPTGSLGEFDPSGLNWFEVTYWRAFNAVDGVLDFNSGDGAGVFQVHATNFLADSTRLYDVTVPEQPVRMVLDSVKIVGPTLTFDFQDSTATGVRRRYIAGAVSYGDPDYGPRTPPAANFQAVTRRGLSSAVAADYLLIVPEAFLPAVQPLVTLRQSQGLNVLVAPAEAVYDEFNGGRHSAAAIQRFVRHAYLNWSTRFVLLVGDGSIDPKRNSPTSGVDWVPTLPIPGPVAVSEGFEIVPGDPIYGCLTGNCNPQAAGAVLTEMMIGRLPVNTLAEANAVVAKLVAYEAPGADPTWRRNLLLLSDDAFSGDTFFGGGGAGGGSGYCHRPDEENFVGLNTKCASIVTRDAGLSQTNAELFNLRYYLANEPWNVTPPADTCRPSRDATRSRTHPFVTNQMMAKLNAGVLWWNFQGHANEYVLTHEDLYVNSGDAPSNDDKYLFANTGRPFLFTAFSCHANMFARNNAGPGSTLGGCLGEDMVTWAQGGAIASWASVCYEVVPRDDSTHVNVELARSLFADPPVDEFVPGDRGARVVLGEAVQATMLRYIPIGGQYYGEQGLALTYTLLGDPASRLSIGRPQTVVTANDVPVTNGSPVRLTTPGDTLRLVADLVSTERLDSLGVYENLGAGDVAVNAAAYSVSPAFPDTAGGGTFGGRRFRVIYRPQPFARDLTYTFRVRDRDGLQSDFRVVFDQDMTLRVDGVPIQNGDAVSPRANLSLYVVSPKVLNPTTDLVLTVNDQAQPFTPAAAPGDPSGREWVLSWTHGDYLLGNYIVKLAFPGGAELQHDFKVTTAVGDLRVQDLLAFPNPFDNDGTAFSFVLLGSEPADIKVDVMTLSGRKIASLVERSVPPGYVQLPWDGRDAEGSTIANGVYLYRLSAKTSGKHVEQLGRMVKLRKPRHVDVATTP